MTERVLGLSAHSPGAAAVLVEDGRPTAAATEGAFTRQPDEAGFPRRAVRHCLREAGVSIDDIDRLVVAEKPLRKFERILVTHLRGFPGTTRSFASSMFRWLGDRLWAKNALVAELGIAPERLRFVEHHHALAGAAFLPSEFPRAAILTVGRGGEWAAATLAKGEGTTAMPLRELHFPHAPTLLFDAVTRHLGLEPERDEARMLAIAAAGEATLLPVMRTVFATGDDGAPALDVEAIRGPFDDGVRVTEKLAALLGPAREAGAPLRVSAADRTDADLAASLRSVLVESMARWLHDAKSDLGAGALCLAGEIVDDPSFAADLRRAAGFDAVYAPPAHGAAAAAVGAALAGATAPQRGPYDWRLGPDVLRGEVAAGAVELADGAAVCAAVSDRVAAGELVGWLRGRLGYGVDAQSGRDVLADPRSAELAARLRKDVTRADPLVTPGAVCPIEVIGELFDVEADGRLALERGVPARPKGDPARFAGVTAVDGRVSVRGVGADTDADLHAVLIRATGAFGAPVLLRAPLALPGETVVRDEDDARRLFERSRLDALVAETRLYTR